MKNSFVNDGFSLLPKAADHDLLAKLNGIVIPKVESVISSLGNRDIGIGSKNGYREIVQRSPRRFDIRFDENDFAPIWGRKGAMADSVPWIESVLNILGEE